MPTIISGSPAVSTMSSIQAASRSAGEEIEHALLSHPIHRAMRRGRTDPTERLGQRIEAYHGRQRARTTRHRGHQASILRNDAPSRRLQGAESVSLRRCAADRADRKAVSPRAAERINNSPSSLRPVSAKAFRHGDRCGTTSDAARTMTDAEYGSLLSQGRRADIMTRTRWSTPMSWLPSNDPNPRRSRNPATRWNCSSFRVPATSAMVSRCGARCRMASGRWSAPSFSSIISGRCNSSSGKGMDVRPHPHIGLATVTYLFDGSIMHRDSEGNIREIQPGAMNLMTAGRGIAHSERTPDVQRRQRPEDAGPAELDRAAGRRPRRSRRRSSIIRSRRKPACGDRSRAFTARVIAGSCVRRDVSGGNGVAMVLHRSHG